MRASVVFAFQPAMKSALQVLQAPEGLRVKGSQELLANRAVVPFDFSPARGTPTWECTRMIPRVSRILRVCELRNAAP